MLNEISISTKVDLILVLDDRLENQCDYSKHFKKL